MSKLSQRYKPKIYVPCASITPHQVNLYSYPIDGYNRTHRFTLNQQNLEDNKHNGHLSNKSKKKLELAFNWLLFNAKPKRVYVQDLDKFVSFKINLITLTLPSLQQHSDQEITQVCMNNFLTVLRKHGLREYVWRAEAQPFTGNIHFHLTTDTYFHYDSLRKWWNQSVELLGYVSRFAAKNMHHNPNSTDVHAVKHVRKLAAYLSKYLSKNRAFPCIGELRQVNGQIIEILYNSSEYRKEEPNRKKGKVVGHVLGGHIRPIESRLWSCSSGLAKCKSVILDGQEYDLKSIFEFVQLSDFYKHQTQWVDSYFGDVKAAAAEIFPQLNEKLQEHFDQKINAAVQLASLAGNTNAKSN